MITHTHIDHVACLPLTMLGEIHREQIFKIYGHEEAEEYIQNYIESMFTLNAMEHRTKETSWYEYIGLKQKDILELLTKKTELEIEIFECDHSIPTISYGISEIKNKLKEEYMGLAGIEIASLRKNEVEITRKVISKKLAYVCDTSIRVFEMNSSILDHDVVFIECTFIMPDEIENAINTKHIHWLQLKKYVIENPNITFMLFHFNQRYRDIEIENFFKGYRM